MKKLWKVIALATALCMLMSVSAFATADGTAVGDKDTKVITANVLGAGADAEVALIVLATGVTPANAAEDDVMFIDQKKADASGNVSFDSILIKDTDVVVDVYAGSVETGGPKLLAQGIDIADVKVITLVTGEDAIITETAVGAQGHKKGFAAAIKVNVPNGLVIDKMIWGFKVAGESFKRYSTAVESPVGSGVSGEVQFAAAFELGLAEDNLEVSEVSAIFLTNDGHEHFTDPDDAQNKK